MWIINQKLILYAMNVIFRHHSNCHMHLLHFVTRLCKTSLNYNKGLSAKLYLEAQYLFFASLKWFLRHMKYNTFLINWQSSNKLLHGDNVDIWMLIFETTFLFLEFKIWGVEASKTWILAQLQWLKIGQKLPVLNNRFNLTVHFPNWTIRIKLFFIYTVNK